MRTQRVIQQLRLSSRRRGKNGQESADTSSDLLSNTRADLIRSQSARALPDGENPNADCAEAIEQTPHKSNNPSLGLNTTDTVTMAR